ncbi:hypothetical protein [Trinickia sp. EG282A]|uniref:hypothetical protein n=1 Tax=Trinickia sp. EG282A TaxID=3237013 RepID=UPI0034D1FCF0
MAAGYQHDNFPGHTWNQVSAGVQYSLSKRTTVYLSGDFVKASSGINPELAGIRRCRWLVRRAMCASASRISSDASFLNKPGRVRTSEGLLGLTTRLPRRGRFLPILLRSVPAKEGRLHLAGAIPSNTGQPEEQS